MKAGVTSFAYSPEGLGDGRRESGKVDDPVHSASPGGFGTFRQRYSFSHDPFAASRDSDTRSHRATSSRKMPK